MRKIFIVLLIILFGVTGAFSATLKNRLKQRIVINLSGGKTISILAGGTIEVSENELKDTQIQKLIQRGDLVVIRSGDSAIKDEKKTKHSKK
jgi:hypothetical protein